MSSRGSSRPAAIVRGWPGTGKTKKAQQGAGEPDRAVKAALQYSHGVRFKESVRVPEENMEHLDGLRAELLKSYMHRMATDCSCSTCGNNTRPLAFHILEKSFPQDTALPASFVPMSKSMGQVRGAFPICTACVPPCTKCNLPIPTERVLEYGHKESSRVGNGVCRHFRATGFLSALFKKSLGIGRFKNS